MEGLDDGIENSLGPMRRRGHPAGGIVGQDQAIRARNLGTWDFMIVTPAHQ